MRADARLCRPASRRAAVPTVPRPLPQPQYTKMRSIRGPTPVNYDQDLTRSCSRTVTEDKDHGRNRTSFTANVPPWSRGSQALVAACAWDLPLLSPQYGGARGWASARRNIATLPAG